MKLNGLKAAVVVLAMTGAAHAADKKLSMNQKVASEAFEKTTIAADIKATEAACKCHPKAKIDWMQFKTEDELKIPAQGYNEAAQSVQEICKKGETQRAAVCADVKTVVVNKGEPKDPTFKDGTVTLTREYNKGYGDLTKVITEGL